MELNPITQQILENEGYYCLREIPNKGICGICNFAFTIAIVMGIDEEGYYGRWCYPNRADAIAAFALWDGVGDPSGEWIKYKGFPAERSRIPDPYDGVQFKKIL